MRTKKFVVLSIAAAIVATGAIYTKNNPNAAQENRHLHHPQHVNEEVGIAVGLGDLREVYAPGAMRNEIRANGEWLAYRVTNTGEVAIRVKVLRDRDVVQEFEVAPHTVQFSQRNMQHGEYRVELQQVGDGISNGEVEDVASPGFFRNR